MKTAFALAGLLMLVAGGGSMVLAQEKADEALAKLANDADIAFVGTIEKVNPLGATRSIPPNVFGEVTFKVSKELRGKVADVKFRYSHKEGSTKHLDLNAKKDVLVLAKQQGGVLAIVPATEANVALVKQAAEEKKE